MTDLVLHELIQTLLDSALAGRRVRHACADPPDMASIREQVEALRPLPLPDALYVSRECDLSAFYGDHILERDTVRIAWREYADVKSPFVAEMRYHMLFTPDPTAKGCEPRMLVTRWRLPAQIPELRTVLMGVRDSD